MNLLPQIDTTFFCKETLACKITYAKTYKEKILINQHSIFKIEMNEDYHNIMYFIGTIS